MSKANHRFNPDRAYFKRHSGTITDRFLSGVVEAAQDIEAKIKNVPALNQLWERVGLSLRLLEDYRAGEYKKIAPWAVAAVLFALLYVVNPVELVPDFIPVIGYLDDVVLVALVLKLVDRELQKYAAWRKMRDAVSPRCRAPDG